MVEVNYELNRKRNNKEFALIYKCKHCGKLNVLYKETLKAKSGTSYFGLKYTDVYPDISKLFIGKVEIPKGYDIFGSMYGRVENSCIKDHNNIAAGFEFEAITFGENVKVIHEERSEEDGENN